MNYTTFAIIETGTTIAIITILIVSVLAAIAFLALCKADSRPIPKPTPPKSKFPQTFQELEDAGFTVIQPRDDDETRDKITEILKK